MEFKELMDFLLNEADNPLTIEQLQVQLLQSALKKGESDDILTIIQEINDITVNYFDNYHFILIANATKLVSIKSPKDVYLDIKNAKPAQKIEIKLNESVIFTKND